MTGNVAGYYGSDHNDRKFKLNPGTVEGGNWLGKNKDEKYFTLVKRDDPGKGTILVYNEEVGQDRLVGWQNPGETEVIPYNGESRTKVEIVNGSKVYTQVSTSDPPQKLPPGLVNPQTGYSVAGNIKSGARPFEVAAFENEQNAKLVNQSGHLQIQRDIEQGVNGSKKGSVGEAVKTSQEITKSNAQTEAGGNFRAQAVLKEALMGEIEERAGTNTEFPTLVYPKTLQADKQDIIRFEVMKYTPSKMKQGDSKLGGFEEVGRGGGGLGGGWKNRTPIGSVTFPIPGGIREDNTVEWGDATMNPIEATFSKIALDFLTSNDAVGTVGDVGNEVKKRQKEIGGGLALAIAQAAVGGTGQLLTRETGAVLNPNMQLLFKQPQLRPFTFTFQLTPREKEEADTVMQIIRLFKQAMAPIRSDSMLFLKSPHTFKLTYLHKTKDHPYIGSIKECALMTCGVDYTADQNYMTYEDGVMTSYSLALQFKELEPVYNDDYGTSNAKNLNFSGAIREGQSRIEGTTDYAVDSGVAPGYGVNDDKGISPLTGQPIDTSKGGSFI